MPSGGPKTMSTLTSSQKAMATQIQQFLAPRIGQPATSYSGQVVPDLLPQYQDVLSNLGQQIKAQNPFQQGQQYAVNTALSGKPSFSLDPNVTNQYFQDSVQTPMLRTFDQQIAPRIAEGFAGYSGFSSRQGTAQQQALSDLQSNLTSSRSQLAYQDQTLGAQLSESAANRQLQGIQYGQSIFNAPIQNSLLASQALSPFQQNLGAQSQSSYDQFLRTLPENSPWNQQALGYIGQQQQAAYNQPGVAQQVTAGATAGMSALALMALLL